MLYEVITICGFFTGLGNDAFSGSAARAPRASRPAPPPGPPLLQGRITSYNVCYTKLLRLYDPPALGSSLLMTAPPNVKRLLLDFRQAARFLLQLADLAAGDLALLAAGHLGALGLQVAHAGLELQDLRLVQLGGGRLGVRDAEQLLDGNIV